ncbi:hypothetical protein BHE90_013584 [Fusarium euwallaceae]|uniref:Uncharacterized protein n=1 Tax=Fusarium euwallaceae TaxID=1147111 RepID=A0A430L8G4_9HYPO|nr:hypothetical protein BHE90_013584 [Fusarium euwallaceae]
MASAEMPVPAEPLARLLGDAKSRQSRPPGATVEDQDDLTASEKQQMSDLVRLWSATESRTDPKAVVDTPESQELFFEEVFQDWQGDQDADITLPTFERKLNQSSVQAGTWSEDLGEKAKKGTGQPEPEPEPEPTSNKKRKRTEEAVSQPPAQRRCRKNVRRCSDKAYLGIIWNKTVGEPKWTWKDNSDQAANGESVNLRHGLDLYAWKDRCLTNYDIHERRLTRIYTRDLVVTSARMRIVKWAEEGAAPNRTPSIYAESCPKLRELDLMVPKVRAYYATMVERMDRSNKAMPTMPTNQNQ